MNGSWKRWAVSVSAAILICECLFAYLNRNGCWLYWRGASGITVFVLLAVWMSLLFGLRWIERMVLLLMLFVAIFLWPEPIVWAHTSAAESHAVGGYDSLG